MTMGRLRGWPFGIFNRPRAERCRTGCSMPAAACVDGTVECAVLRVIHDHQAALARGLEPPARATAAPPRPRPAFDAVQFWRDRRAREPAR